MCKLMDTTSGNDLDIPRPSAEMLENIYSRLGSRNIYHYRDCAGRAMRDCRVFNAATSFLQKLFNAVSAAAVL